MLTLQALWLAIDPHGLHGLMNYTGSLLLQGTAFYLGTAMYVAILFHW